MIRRTLAHLLRILAETVDKPIRDPTASEHRDGGHEKHQPAQHIVAELQVPASEIQRQEARDRKQHRLAVWRLVIEVMTLVAVIAAAGFALRQVFVMKEQVRAMERASELTDRAWLIGQAASVSIEKDGTLILQTKFMNTGKGPAFFVRHGIAMTSDSKRPAIEAPRGTGSELTLPAGATTTTEIRVGPPLGQDYARMMQSLPRVFVWLRIKYSDPFSDARETVECWYTDRRLKSLGICSGGQVHN